MTAYDSDIDEIVGLELGADDYLSKPVEPRRLLARVRALLRRRLDDSIPQSQNSFPGHEDIQLRFDNLYIDRGTRQVQLNQEILDLTTAEFDLLWLLASLAGNILSRDDILNKLRGINFDGLDRSIDARISRLRKKLFDDPDSPTWIKTIRGKGYLFVPHRNDNA